MARRKRRLPPRNAKGMFMKQGSARRRTTRRKRTYSASRRRTTRRTTRRRVTAKATVMANPRRRRRRSYAAPARRRRRTYRRNPSIRSIFSKPTLKNVGFAVVGLAGTPMLSSFANQYLPSMLTTNRWGQYAVKVMSAWGLSFGVGKIAGKEAGRSVFIGGLAYVAMGALQDFFPGLLSMGSGGGTSRYLGTRKQPLLAGTREYMRGTGSNITATTPTRLAPGSRF